ncbi:hypothetical protein LXL04_004419 [Taraxacum kok-saghyz]
MDKNREKENRKRIANWGLEASKGGRRNALMRTSWTDLNPGRRFWGYPNPFSVSISYAFSFFFCSYSKRSTCGFIGWIDGPMCERSKHVIPGLLRSMNRVERALEKSKEEAEKLKIYMFCSWVVFVAVLVIMY